MKTYSLTLILMLLPHPFGIMGQGTFRNMDFEQAQIPQGQPNGIVSADLAFPFWTVYYGSTQQTQVHWNELSLGSTQATLLGQNGVPPDGLHKALDGGYSLDLFGGAADCSISQVGQIPTDMVSLLFRGQMGGGATHQLIVSIGGVSLPIFDVSGGPNYDLYGVNVSQFAGMQEDLRFTALPYGAWGIDDIVFSTTPVPEPTTGALVVLGALVVGLRKLVGKA